MAHRAIQHIWKRIRNVRGSVAGYPFVINERGGEEGKEANNFPFFPSLLAAFYLLLSPHSPFFGLYVPPWEPFLPPFESRGGVRDRIYSIVVVCRSDPLSYNIR